MRFPDYVQSCAITCQSIYHPNAGAVLGICRSPMKLTSEWRRHNECFEEVVDRISSNSREMRKSRDLSSSLRSYRWSKYMEAECVNPSNVIPTKCINGPAPSCNRIYSRVQHLNRHIRTKQNSEHERLAKIIDNDWCQIASKPLQGLLIS